MATTFTKESKSTTTFIKETKPGAIVQSEKWDDSKATWDDVLYPWDEASGGLRELKPTTSFTKEAKP